MLSFISGAQSTSQALIEHPCKVGTFYCLGSTNWKMKAQIKQPAPGHRARYQLNQEYNFQTEVPSFNFF